MTKKQKYHHSHCSPHWNSRVFLKNKSRLSSQKTQSALKGKELSEVGNKRLPQVVVISTSWAYPYMIRSVCWPWTLAGSNLYISLTIVDEKQQIKENAGTSAPANKVKDVVRQQNLEKKSSYKKDNTSFDFNRFLEQMKHKSTQSIAKYVKRLVSNIITWLSNTF